MALINSESWKIISKNYLEEREKNSFPALLIDNQLKAYLELNKFNCILDFGAGIGTISKIAAEKSKMVVAYEPNDSMYPSLKEYCNSSPNITTCDSLNGYDAGCFDLILSINVLDHIENIDEILKLFYELLAKEGALYISIPHPMKDFGDWEKSKKEHVWDFLYYKIDDYQKEGICYKNREDQYGNVLKTQVPTYHWKISTYLNAIRNCGFEIVNTEEPAPNASAFESHPVLYSKCSRIPYFFIIHAKKNEK